MGRVKPKAPRRRGPGAAGAVCRTDATNPPVPTSPLFMSHPTDNWVAEYLETCASPSANGVCRDEHELVATAFLGRYQSLARTGGPATDVPAALHGLSLLLACGGSVRTKAAATAAALLQVPATADPTMLPALFSYARDVLIAIAAGEADVDPRGSDVVDALETVAMRLAGALYLGALDDFELSELSEFAGQAAMLELAAQEADGLADNEDVLAGIGRILAALSALKRRPPAGDSTSVVLAVAAVHRHHFPRRGGGRRGGDDARRADTEDVVLAIDADVARDCVVAAELGLRVLGLLASCSATALSTMMRMVGKRFGSGSWPARLAHPYCQVLARVALGGQSSKIRRMVFDRSRPGSLAHAGMEHGWGGAGPSGAGPMGEDGGTDKDGDEDSRIAYRWASVKALLTVKAGGAMAMAYAWLPAAAAETLATRADAAAAAAVVVSLDHRPESLASILSLGGGPFGFERTLCATAEEVAGSADVPSTAADSARAGVTVPSQASPSRSERKKTLLEPIVIKKRPTPQLKPRVDVVTRNANGLRLLLGAQVLKAREADTVRRSKAAS